MTEYGIVLSLFAMKHIIIQSFRTTNVPSWIERCMLSVRMWAEEQGYEYQFYDDVIFKMIPDQVMKKIDARGDIPFICKTDLARLYAAKYLLNCEYFDEEGDKNTRVTWIDADVLIMDPTRFVLKEVNEDNFVATQEVWHHRTVFGIPLFTHKINNALMTFRNAHALNMYIRLAEHILFNAEKVHNLMIGPELLTSIYNHTRSLQIQRGVGCFGDATIEAIFKNPARIAKQLKHAYGCGIYAANLTNSGNRSAEYMHELVTKLKQNACLFAANNYRPEVFVGDGIALKNFRRIKAIKCKLLPA